MVSSSQIPKSAAELQRIVTSEAQLRQAQEVAGVGSWEWNIVSNQISWSEQLFRTFGLNPDDFEATYEAYLERIHPEDLDLVNETVQKAFADHQPWSFEHRICRPNGEVRWVFGQGAVVVENGQPVRMYGTEQDITQQRADQELREKSLRQEILIQQLQETNEFRINLLNTVAHEMNTPLTPLHHQTFLLQGSFDEGTEEARSVEILQRNIRRLQLLVADILDMSKMESKKLEIRPAPMDLAAVVDDAIETYQGAAEQAEITLISNLPEVPITADADRLTQVLYNLVGNAIKFTPPKGTITVDARVTDAHVELDVVDTGLGIGADEAEHLFEAFAQVHPGQKQHGTGLGLYISKEIVERHGGTLVMSSGGRDQGTTFTMRLPRA